MDLSTTLRNARERIGLDQKDVSDKVNVAQGTVSAWETGQQVPTRKYLSTLADLYNVDLALLEEAARTAAKTPRASRTLSARQYLRQQQEYLAALGDDRRAVKVCFLGPESLPVVDSIEVQEAWVENLAAGTTYCVLWFLCLVEPGALGRLAPVLRRIGEAARGRSGDSCGVVEHYGLRLISASDESTFLANLREFEECNSRKLAGNAFRNYTDDGTMSEELKRRLLRHAAPEGSLVVYHHGDIARSRLASLSLRATRESPEGPEHASFYFLGNKLSEDLDRLMRDFFKAMNAASPTSGVTQ